MTRSRRKKRRRLGAHVAATAIGLAALGGCGGDHATDDETTTATTPELSGEERDVADAVTAFGRAVDRGAVRTLCRPGRLLSPAAVRELEAEAEGCEGVLATRLKGLDSLKVTVEDVSVKGQFAVATVERQADGDTVSVMLELVRSRSRWLLSPVDGANPVFALLRGQTAD